MNIAPTVPTANSGRQRQASIRICPDVSSRIESLRFVLVVGVVAVHAYAPHTYENELRPEIMPWWLSFARYLIGGVLAKCAVPLFSLFSGYLFFTGFDGSLKSYQSKISSRIWSLLVPYIIWNVLVAGAIIIGRALPASEHYFNPNNGLLRSQNWLEAVNAVFGFTTKPIAYQFWFIRNLFLACAVSPLFYMVLNWRGGWLVCLTLTGIWLLDAHAPGLGLAYSFSFFYWGAWLALSSINLRALDSLWLVFLSVYTVFALAFATMWHMGWQVNLQALQPLIVFGCITLWLLTSRILENRKLLNCLAALGPFAFFLFASHEPTLRAVTRVLIRILRPLGSADIVALSVLPVVIVSVAAVVTALFLKARFPLVYRLVSGQRAGRAPVVGQASRGE